MEKVKLMHSHFNENHDVNAYDYSENIFNKNSWNIVVFHSKISK